MSFNRLKYDVCETKKTLAQSKGIGNYFLQRPNIEKSCIPDSARVISQQGGDARVRALPKPNHREQIDVESDLFNIDRVASRCPDKKYDPRQSNCGCETQGLPSGGGVVAGCGDMSDGGRCGDSDLTEVVMCKFPVEDTRLSNPASNLRGTGINRFNYLFVDPQDDIFFPGMQYVNSRLLAKDNHRPCLPDPKINNMTPPQLPMRAPRITPVKANPTQPLYQFDVFG